MHDLNIVRMRAYAVIPPEMPAARYTGFEEPYKRNIEILRLTLANGIEGIACCDTGTDGDEAGSVVRNIRDLSSQVIGQSVARRETLTESLLPEVGEGPWEGVSIIDCAMWDAFAQSEGKPLWQMLGGYQERIQAYSSTVAFLSIQEYLDEIQKYATLGYGAIKLHLFTDIDFDLELVKAVAKAHQDSHLRFMVDLEESSNFDDAVRLGNALEGLPFDWMEAPLPDHDLDAYIELSKAVAIDIAPAGNTLVGMDKWEEGLRSGAWSRLRCDVTNGGGVTTVLKGVKLAQSMHAPVELQSFGYQPTQHANLHIMLGLAGCTWFEHPSPQEPYDYAGRSPILLDQQGTVAAADAPGMGLDMNWEQIEADAFESFATE